jgi:hypothetical protein
MVKRPGMASLHLCHPERSEGSLREWASKEASPAGKARTMNTYEIISLNVFGMHTYAMDRFVKPFGMNTYAKSGWGEGVGYGEGRVQEGPPASCEISAKSPSSPPFANEVRK